MSDVFPTSLCTQERAGFGHLQPFTWFCESSYCLAGRYVGFIRRVDAASCEWTAEDSDMIELASYRPIVEHLMSTLIHRQVEDCRAGRNPKTIARVSSGWVVLGDAQFLPGYSLLLPDPVVVDLNALSQEQRETYLYEMSVIGDALLDVTDAYRVNYEILGNTEPALHAHIFPRYQSEPEELRRVPVWSYDWKNAPAFDPGRDRPVIDRIANYLRQSGIVA